MNKHQYVRQAAASIGLLLFLSCGSIIDFGDDRGVLPAQEGTRVIQGKLRSAAAMSLSEKPPCAADSVRATDTIGETIATHVNENCDFSLDLDAGKSYGIAFFLGEEALGNLLFNSGHAGFATESLPVSNDNNPIDLGLIKITGNIARAENEPLAQCDRDRDHQNDLVDDDDDNDGIKDLLEPDCDLDGTPDDIDQVAKCSEHSVKQVQLLEAKPRNNPAPHIGNATVDLERNVRFRVACSLDRDSVTPTSFRVKAEDGSEISCGFLFSGKEHSSLVECTHSQPFQADRIYAATVNGLKCKDGRTVASKIWFWRTERIDLDKGDYEDQIDFMNSLHYLEHDPKG